MLQTLIKARLIENRAVGPLIYRADLDAPEIAAQARPGQFVMVRVDGRTGPSLDPLLRRPLSIHDVPDRKAGLVRLLYRKVGRGTALLAQARPGEAWDLFGPLGQGFPAVEGPKLLLGGGLGLAPLLFLARETAGQADGRLRLGARNAAELVCLDDFKETGLELSIFTEDGSAGEKGLVTKGLAEELKSRPATIFACGPEAMLKAVAGLAADQGLACYLSLERRMACGLGACLGCAVEDSAGGYARVCQEGPVFEASGVRLVE